MIVKPEVICSDLNFKEKISTLHSSKQISPTNFEESCKSPTSNYRDEKGCTQCPQALWPAVSHQERFWVDWLPCKIDIFTSTVLTQKFCVKNSTFSETDSRQLTASCGYKTATEENRLEASIIKCFIPDFQLTRNSWQAQKFHR